MHWRSIFEKAYLGGTGNLSSDAKFFQQNRLETAQVTYIALIPIVVIEGDIGKKCEVCPICITAEALAVG